MDMHALELRCGRRELDDAPVLRIGHRLDRTILGEEAAEDVVLQLPIGKREMQRLVWRNRRQQIDLSARRQLRHLRHRKPERLRLRFVENGHTLLRIAPDPAARLGRNAHRGLRILDVIALGGQEPRPRRRHERLGLIDRHCRGASKRQGKRRYHR